MRDFIITFIVVAAASVVITLLFRKFLRIEKKELLDFVDILRKDNLIGVKSVDLETNLSESGIPKQVLKGRVGSPVLRPFSCVEIMGRKAFLFGYRSRHESMDLYANRSILAVDLNCKTPIAIVDGRRGLGKGVIQTMGGFLESCKWGEDSKIVKLFSDSSGTLGDAAETDLLKRFPQSLFGQMSDIEWVEFGGGYVVFIGKRKIGIGSFRGLYSNANQLCNRLLSR